jgi:phage N-6-adenine-methyltransferase
MSKGLFLSKKSDWRTPMHILYAVHRVMDGIDLDPCADMEKQVPADHHYTKEDDGLSKEWHGKVFMNPPYGRETSPVWAAKWKKEYESGHLKKGIVLVAARTDTKWWEDVASTASVVCFTRRRLRFGDDSGKERTPSTFPSAILYACRDNIEDIERFAKVFSKYGNIWVKYGVK